MSIAHTQDARTGSKETYRDRGCDGPFVGEEYRGVSFDGGTEACACACDYAGSGTVWWLLRLVYANGGEEREREREEDRRLVGGDAMGVDESLKRSGLAKVGGGWM